MPDRLRVVSNTGQNLRINVDTRRDDDRRGAESRRLDRHRGRLHQQLRRRGHDDVVRARCRERSPDDPGPAVRQSEQRRPASVGALGIDVQAATGFDISGVNNAAFAAVTLAGATTSELHTINLASGASTRVNAIGGGERVRGLALNANPRATLLGVTTDNRLVTFKTTSPGTLDTNVAVTGLQGGETIIGYRFASGERPALRSDGCCPPLHARCDHGRGDDRQAC